MGSVEPGAIFGRVMCGVASTAPKLFIRVQICARASTVPVGAMIGLAVSHIVKDADPPTNPPWSLFAGHSPLRTTHLCNRQKRRTALSLDFTLLVLAHAYTMVSIFVQQFARRFRHTWSVSQLFMQQLKFMYRFAVNYCLLLACGRQQKTAHH